MQGFFAIIARDLRLLWRDGQAAVLAIGFFIVTISLFPLSLGPEPHMLRRVAGGVIWVAALFAVMLSLERMFGPDQEDGSLEQLMLESVPLGAVVLAKAIAHWLSSAGPLILAAPFAALVLHLPLDATVTLCLALLLGTPALSLIGGVGAALTLGMRQGGVVLSLLILPLFVPVLVFGAGAVTGIVTGTPTAGALSLLAAISLAALVVAPPVTAAALRLALE
ncbi:MAG: heme exporter protein CcmB [Sphingomonadales bacterium]